MILKYEVLENTLKFFSLVSEEIVLEYHTSFSVAIHICLLQKLDSIGSQIQDRLHDYGAILEEQQKLNKEKLVRQIIRTSFPTLNQLSIITYY